jgi:hypothetical protein
MPLRDMTQCSGLADTGGGSPAHKSARIQNSKGGGTVFSCWNLMVAP